VEKRENIIESKKDLRNGDKELEHLLIFGFFFRQVVYNICNNKMKNAESYDN